MIVYAGNDIEKAIRELKRKVDKDGLLRELRDKSYFLSRGERRRLKDRENLKRLQKWQRKREMIEREREQGHERKSIIQ